MNNRCNSLINKPKCNNKNKDRCLDNILIHNNNNNNNK